MYDPGYCNEPNHVQRVSSDIDVGTGCPGQIAGLLVLSVQSVCENDKRRQTDKLISMRILFFLR